MTFLQLEYFQKIIRTGSMSAAARELHISQPALSKSISVLEQELGVELFEKQGRTCTLSPSGEIYARYTDVIFHALSDAKAEADDIHATRGTVIISPNAGPSFLPDLVAGFHKTYPNIKISLVKYQLQQKTISNKEPDFYFTVSNPAFHIGANSDSGGDGHSIALIKEDICLAVAAGHPLAARKSICLQELVGQDLILLPESSYMRQIINRAALATGVKLEPTIECSEWSNLLYLIERNAGIGFVPRYSWGKIDPSRAALISIENENCSRIVSLNWTPQSYISTAANLFRDYITGYFAQMDWGQLC